MRSDGVRASRPARVRGFTLLEAVVAVAVLAIGITALQRLIVDGVGTVATDARLTRAMLAAQGLLAEASVHPPEPGHVTGEQPGLHWERDVTTTPHPALREVRVRAWTEPSRRDACELVEILRVPTR